MPSKKLRSGIEAHRLAMQHVDMLTEAGTELRSDPNIARMINGLSRGIPFGWSYEDSIRFSMETRIKVGDLMGEIAVCDMWKRNGRVVYDLHEELAASLYRSKTNTVPGRLFERLPHINPLVVLPDPWPVSKGRNKLPTSFVRGFFIFGWTGTALCDTNDPAREGIGIMFLYDHLDEETGELVPGGQRDVIPLPTSREKFTVEEAIKHAAEWQGDIADTSDPMKIFKPLLQQAFSVITYLCVDNRDVEEPRTIQHRKKTGRGRKGPDRDPFWVRVGWHIGPGLHESRRRAGVKREGLNFTSPSGLEFGPQHRAGHTKTVWIGPGKSGERKQSTSTWVEPYWTKLDELPEGTDPATMVVPVNPQRRDPLRRRDTIGR